MTWNCAYTPHIWPSALTILLLVVLISFAWQRRNVPGVIPFIVYCLLSVPLIIFKMIGYLAVDFESKVFWFKVESAWWLPVATAMTCFCLEYANPGRWLTRRNLLLLSIAPLLGLVFIVTNMFHLWATPSYGFNGSVTPLYGPVGRIFMAYGFGLLLTNIVVFVWLFIRSPHHRWPVVLILIAQTAVRILALVDPVNQDSWFFHLPEMGLTVVACAIALFGFHLFDPVDLARLTVMEQFSDGMLVLDDLGRVASLNPAAEKIFALTARQVKGRPVREILPAYPLGSQPIPSGTEIEFSLSSGGTASDYQLVISHLNDYRGQEAGRLLLLRDVTEQKRAQAQLIQQQQALAMLHEREQLARELHDSTAQVLGFAGFQIEVVQDRLQDGKAAICAGEQASAATQLAQAQHALAHLGSAVEEAHADLREYILNLRLSPSDQRPFFVTLRDYLDGFSQNYGLLVDLSVGLGIDDETFHPQAQMQLFRIIQEALSNARKHARASCVQVSFETQNGLRCISIQDNGLGFDSSQQHGDRMNHFGLLFMQERAGELGGILRVDSSPGQGTCVRVELPAGKS